MFKRTRGVSTTDIVTKLLKISELIHKGQDPTNPEESKQEGCELEIKEQVPFPKMLGSFNANPNFLASAKRIANFANTKEPKETDKIVYVDGSFDICHPGHIELLRKCHELGDFLIVGIHEDQCVNQYLGVHFPLNTLHERVLNILACKYVDDVIIGAPFKITERLLKDLNVSVVVKSLEYYQGTIKDEALNLEPYGVAEKFGLVQEVKIECPITMKALAERVYHNKELMEKKIQKYSARQDHYEMTASYISEVS